MTESKKSTSKATHIRTSSSRKDLLARTYLKMLAEKPATSHARPPAFPKSLDATADARTAAKKPVPLTIRPDLALTAVLLAREIEKHVGLAERIRAGAIVVIRTSDNKQFSMVQCVLEKSVVGKTGVENLAWIGGRPDEGFLTMEDGMYRGNVLDTLSAAFSLGLTVIGLVADHNKQLPDLLTECAECELVIGKPDMSAICLALQFSTGLSYGPELPANIVQHVTGTDLVAAVRPGRSLEHACAQLTRMISSRITIAVKPTVSGPLLDDLHGYGAAKTWGLEAVDDLRAYAAGTLAWDHCDHRALLLSGPPGVGKTMFARALANTAGLPLIATSVADWNAVGHLGDTLKAIKKTFAEARKKAPCIVFIDELDGISSRGNLSGDYVEYWLQIVNLLLEELQSTSNNEGVMIIAASNSPERIDPAILRSGRLDNHVRIEMPDYGDLQAIYRYCLSETALEEAAISRLAAASLGCSGADIDAYVRRAKSAARRKNEPLDENHIAAQIGSIHLRLNAEDLRRLAIHEAGHAVVYYLSQKGEFQQLTLTKTGGQLIVQNAVNGFSGRADLELAMLSYMAGPAAEEIVFGEASIGYAAGELSDLMQATKYAVTIQLFFKDRVGYGGTFQHALVKLPGLYEKVSEHVSASLATATQMIADELPLLHALADALVTSHHIDRIEFEKICTEFGNKHRACPCSKAAV